MFNAGDFVHQINSPSMQGQVTGNVRSVGSRVMWEVSFASGQTQYVEQSYLVHVPKVPETMMGQLLSGRLGRPEDLQRKMTYEKLQGSLSEYIYSMDSAEIDFLPYQYKPVLKFIESPAERMLLADEVGLGKTIEASLVWREVQARRDAKRLLIVCPKTLANNWRSELSSKFGIDAQVVNATGLKSRLDDLVAKGESTRWALIATYSGIRAPQADLLAIREEKPVETDAGRLAYAWDTWDQMFYFADLLIFDEAHTLRNAGSLASRTARMLAGACSSILCVSATPINNKNDDLRSILRILDPGTFENEDIFRELLEQNKPAVAIANALMHQPPNFEAAKLHMSALKEAEYIAGSDLLPMFEATFNAAVEANRSPDERVRAEALAKAQRIVEQLNVLGSYVSRTRRRQVHEMPAIRKPVIVPVTLTDMERRFYEAVTSIIRKRAIGAAGRLGRGSLSIIQSISPQLRMASCIPATVKSYQENAQYFIENVIDTIEPDDADEPDDEGQAYKEEMLKLIEGFKDYDFEANDTKFSAFIDLLRNKLKDDNKIVVFAYFRATLDYLSRRLRAEGFSNIVLHGGISSQDERTDVIEQFAAEDGPRVLLSSEVGSEGINLQFSRVVVNYDLPWNPMKVEQRIGRVDRVGQKAKVISVVHFKSLETIDGRVFELLHEKLENARIAIGDMESILGEEVKALTVELFGNTLTPEQEKQKIENRATVIMNRVQMQMELEEHSSAFEGLSDFLRAQINRTRQLGRYVTPSDLKAYITAFVEGVRQGTTLKWDHQLPDVFRVDIKPPAAQRFDEYVKRHMPDAAVGQTGSTIIGTLLPEVAQRKLKVDGQRVVLVTHLSPLLRWITSELKVQSLHAVSVSELNSTLLPAGDYLYVVERWHWKAVKSREVLFYGLINLSNGHVFMGDDAEKLFQDLLVNAKPLPSYVPDASVTETRMEQLRDAMNVELDAATNLFEAENQNLATIQRRQIDAHYKHRIAQDNQRLESSRLSGKPQALEFARRLIERTNDRYSTRMANLDEKLSGVGGDFGASDVAMGIVRVNPAVQ